MLNVGNWLKQVSALSVGLLALAGCGGGGATGSSGGNAAVGFYVGDGFGDNYSEVWTTLYHVDASINGSTWTPVFDSSSGMQVNLSALSSTVQFMGGMNMTPGSYTVARITMADHMRLVATGGAVTNPPVAAPGGSDVGGKYTFSVSMPMNLVSGQMANMALEFNLANFQMQGGVLQMSVGQMDPGRFNGMQHQGWLHGTVSSLNPGTSFSLSMGMMHSVTIQLSSSTLITSQSTGQAATLANGQSVDVQGTVDPSTHVLTATSVQVRDGNGGMSAQLQGSVASVDGPSGSFTVSPSWAMNFTPNGSTVTVQTNSNTIFTKGMMMGTGSFADITQGGTVMVTGSYDSGTGVVTANRVRMF